MHGAGEPHRGYVAYHQQNGSSYCGGVTVSWNLADAGPGDGGFACVSGSHKLQFPRPVGVRTADEDMGLIEQPIVGAGDVLFFMDGAGRSDTYGQIRRTRATRDLLGRGSGGRYVTAGTCRHVWPRLRTRDK